MNTATFAPGALGASPEALAAAHPGTPGGVQIEHLTVRFGTRTVLDDLSLNIERGELLTVLGRSGCGKTTLLRFIAGFIEADGLAGTLTVAGHDLTHVPPHKRNLGLLFQSYALFPHLSVFENVA
ncbi:MAG: ATP-binding cassette domain-containing protein, partial [Paraburkholderia sp.]